MQVAYSRVRVDPSCHLVDIALVQQGEVVLALLLQNKAGVKGGSMTQYPMASVASHELPDPDGQLQQVTPLQHQAK